MGGTVEESAPVGEDGGMTAAPLSYRSPWRQDEHDDLADVARTFFTRDVVPHLDKYTAQGHPDREAYQRAGAQGLLGVSVPQSLGGGGGTFAHEAVVFEQQVRSGDSSLGLGVHSGIVMGYLVAYGSPEQQQRWLPALCRGDLVGAIAMTEPGAGSDLQSMRTTATRDGDDYVVQGSKMFITNGFLADLVILAVKTDPSARAAGVSLLVCEVTHATPGFTRGRVLHKIGMQANDTAELFFDGMRVPARNMLGDLEGQGFVQLMTQLPQERLVIAVSAVAAMEQAVALTIDYTKNRTAFGKPLFELQNTRFVLAEATATARAGRTLLDHAIGRHLDGELDAATAAMVKFWTTDAQNRVIDSCLQLFGGYGYSMEYPIARLYADARVQRIYAGANEIMKELVARVL
jgi:acyl-CoA dehydrogenase